MGGCSHIPSDDNLSVADCGTAPFTTVYGPFSFREASPPVLLMTNREEGSHQVWWTVGQVVAIRHRRFMQIHRIRIQEAWVSKMKPNISGLMDE